MKEFKPMLASPAPAKIQFPVLASPKLDGIRAVVKDGIVVSRSLKPIPNNHIQEILGDMKYEGLDGELTVGPPNVMNTMQASMSGVMSEDGIPDFTFWVFDYWNGANDIYYKQRYERIKDRLACCPAFIQVLEHHMVMDEQQLNIYEAQMLGYGFEGIMIRSLTGPYKYGRSTAREGWLLKVKRFQDSEAMVIGFEEKMHNANEQTRDERGYAKRSSHQDGLVPAGTLGSLLVKTAEGIEFGIGTGFDDHMRATIWAAREKYLGKIVTYKHFANAGVKTAPRFPVFKAFRHQDDL